MADRRHHVAGGHRELTHGDASTGAEVHLLVPLYDPAGGRQLLVDLNSRLGLGPR
jgi:hypothetical protein